MPNWAINRLILSGPTAEIERFRTTCIRLQRGHDTREINLDFEAIIPMPPAILATLDDRSSAASDRARAATGFDDWFNWSLVSWGTKWNASGLAILNAEPDLLDLTFDTAWNSPEPIFRALAEQYPHLRGYALGTDPAMDWAVFGLLDHGTYASRCADAAELGFLVEDCMLTAELSRTCAQALVQNWATIASSNHLGGAPLSPAAAATSAVKAALPGEVTVKLEFAGTYRAYSDSFCDFDADNVAGDTAIDVAFFKAQGRCRTDLDLELLEDLADTMRQEAACPSSYDASLLGFLATAAGLAECCGEDRLRSWAAHVMYRPGVSIDMSDIASLRGGFVAYAGRLYEETVAYLKERAAALEMGAGAAAGLGA